MAFDPISLSVIIVLAAVAGGGITYGVVKATIGCSATPLDNSNIGTLNWDGRQKNAIIDVDMDFRGSGMLLEIGIISIICVLSFFCFCWCCCRREAWMMYGMFYHQPDEDRWRRQRHETKEKRRTKKTHKQEKKG